MFCASKQRGALGAYRARRRGSVKKRASAGEREGSLPLCGVAAPTEGETLQNAFGQVHAGTWSTDKGNFLVLCFRLRPFSMTMLSPQHFRAALGAVVSPPLPCLDSLGVGHRAWDWPEALR